MKVFYDAQARILTVWFGRPSDEHVCEETGDEVILLKDRQGRVIGFERLNFHGPAGGRLAASLETTGEK